MQKEGKNMKKQNDVEQISSYVRQIIRNMRTYGRKLLAKENLTFPQYYTLTLLAGKEKCNMDSLKNDLATSGAVATKVMDHLVEKKLADRGKWSEDRRVVNIVITDKGKKLLDFIDKKRISFYTSILGKMKEVDKKQIIKGLKILTEALLTKEGNQE